MVPSTSMAKSRIFVMSLLSFPICPEALYKTGISRRALPGNAARPRNGRGNRRRRALRKNQAGRVPARALRRRTEHGFMRWTAPITPLWVGAGERHPVTEPTRQKIPSNRLGVRKRTVFLFSSVLEKDHSNLLISAFNCPYSLS